MVSKLLSAVLVFAAIAASFPSLHAAENAPISVVLTYEIDQPRFVGQQPVEMNTVLAKLNQRIHSVGRARSLDKKRLEVDVYGSANAADLEWMKRLIGGAGYLEFRIVADYGQVADRSIIELAKAAPATQNAVLQGDNKVAEWVTYDTNQFGPPEKHRYMVTRKNGDRIEVLVRMDPMNVTCKYLETAAKGMDEDGKLVIVLSFNKEGAARLEKLTKQNLANPATPEDYRQLGIILDKRMMTAPVIRSVISENAMISGGSMTEREIGLVVDILQGGMLPFPMRLVSEKRVSEKK